MQHFVSISVGVGVEVAAGVEVFDVVGVDVVEVVGVAIGVGPKHDVSLPGARIKTPLPPHIPDTIYKHTSGLVVLVAVLMGGPLLHIAQHS